MDYKSLAEKSGLMEKNLKKIEEMLIQKNNFTKERIHAKMMSFFGALGIDKYYFQTTPLNVIAGHVESLRAAEIISENACLSEVDVDIRSEQHDENFYLVADTLDKTTEIELRIDRLFDNYRLQSYRTHGKAGGASFLRLYFIEHPRFEESRKHKSDFYNNINVEFLKTSTKETIKRYEEVYEASRTCLAPYVAISQKPDTHETRIMTSLPPYTSEDFLSKFSGVMNTYGLLTTRKYVEPMKDGRRIFSFYLKEIKDKKLLEQLKQDISMIALVGKMPIDDLFIKGTFTATEYIYAFCLAHLAHQFITSHTEQIEELKKELAQKPELRGILRFLKIRLVKDTYTLDRIFQTIRQYPDIIKSLYCDFQQRFAPNPEPHQSPEPIADVLAKLKRNVSLDIHKNIVQSFIGFNRLILKTNFYKKNKTSISFRLSPDVLDASNYPDLPFGIFFVAGKEFLGFHIRFHEIARGGIRIVRSATMRDYVSNADFIFDENYRLAHTQEKKNKDIPEGGSKGAILLGAKYQNMAEIAFKKYIDGLLDLVLKEPEVKDYFGREEILFLGPDEGSAHYMDWASQYARERGYIFWKAFTTGKSPKLGGIPHDLYGMTTAGVHEYELQILKKLGLDEKNVTKFQTGGPDGDLGSNEILVSQNKYIAVVDGSGALYDAKGIDTNELRRLAKLRSMVKNFDRKKISKEGFLVLIEDRSVKLFDGTVVANGTDFRNNFHLTPYARADIFVPCGGRPQSIHILNWKQLLNAKGELAFKIIVEGANLFISQEARLELEKRNCILIKDASSNKGGVTSSSLEVLASLALSNDEYDALLTTSAKKDNPFRKKYIEEVLECIRHNARREFDILWRENRENNTPFAILTDRLSEKINTLGNQVFNSNLFESQKLREVVISKHIPKVLLNKLGIKTILKRIPVAYQRSIFASIIASDFIYTHGLNPSEVDFSSYIEDMKIKD